MMFGHSFKREWKIDISIIVVLCLAALIIRLPIIAERKIMPAGDAFNFQHITSQIQHLSYPIKEKRLPTYPILLLPGRWIGADPIDTSITVSLLAGIGIITVLYLLGRQLSIRREALLIMLGLSIFNPLLTINSIRPLADSTFVFFMLFTVLLVTKILNASTQPTRRFLTYVGAVTTLMMFTRYEGFLVAGLLFPLLFLRLNWRDVLFAAIIPFVTTVAWIPAYLHIHGSLGGLAYVSDATTPGGDFGRFELIPNNAYRMMIGSGWASVWDIPNFEVTEGKPTEAAAVTLSTASWWLGLLGLIGIPWFVIRSHLAGLPIIVAAVGYTLLLSWWWVYGRYVAPLSAVFYLSAAGGLSAFLTIGEGLSLKAFHYLRLAVYGLIVTFGIWILYTESLGNYKTALSGAWENNQREYELLSATKYLHRQSAPVAYATEAHAFATLYLGILGEQKSRTNEGLGWYLSRHPDATVSELYDIAREKNIRYILATDFDPRVKSLVELLDKRGEIKQKRIFTEVLWVDLVVDTVSVYEIMWK